MKQDPAKWSKKRKRDDTDLNAAKQGKGHAKKSKTSIEISQPTPAVKASESQPATNTEAPKPFNPYEGLETALQLDESIDSFLTRLPPSTAETKTPWIYCANFNTGQRPTTPDIAAFKQDGTRLLDTFLAKRAKLEAKFDPPKAEGVITRMMSNDRAQLENDIITTAKKHDLVNGKWMLFPTRDKVDQYWEAVVRGTVDGRLGTAAKVATNPEKVDDPSQVICVYTKDMSDVADVKRVLLELVRLKLAPAITDRRFQKGTGGALRAQIWYKPDCHTYLDITSGNEYKIKPTMYGTASLLTFADVKVLN